MCGIAGFYQGNRNYLKQPDYYQSILTSMNKVQLHRGPDEQGSFLAAHVGLSHVRLSIIDLATGKQPLLRTANQKTWGIVYNGELYNTNELRKDLQAHHWSFETTSDTEVILLSYIQYGIDFVKRLNGIFAFCIWDPVLDEIILYRDRSGIKPLFYTRLHKDIIFSSELKGLLAYPGVKPILDHEGMNEIFSLGPAKTYGSGVFKHIKEVLPGHYLRCHHENITEHCYWKLESHSHEDDFPTTIRKTKELVIDSIQRQMVSDVPICTFLSGGLDSSLVSAVCANELSKNHEKLSTFSFDFKDNQTNFKSSYFQPSQDRPYVDIMVHFLNSNHHYLECSTTTQADYLRQSVLAHDLPAMADVDSSMLYFCEQVKPFNKVALTGECADEIFGGYPWFHKQECFDAHTFPWTMDLSARKALLRDDFIDYLGMDEYVLSSYEKSVSETPRYEGDSPTERRRREISFLNQKWFMQTLLDRMDRASMFSGLEARVPFADHRILDYVWNIPWEMKSHNNIAKALLRECSKGLLPDAILNRRKSPYPKTYDTNYENLMIRKVQHLLSNPDSPVLSFIDPAKVRDLIKTPSDYGKPWYGQLMAGPQMFAYLYQINFWMEQYHVILEW